MKKYYRFRKYDDKGRWMSYWHQINEVLGFEPSAVLEIGIGNKIVSETLKREVILVKTLDADESLEPDIVASIEKIPLEDNSFDVVLCAEVLEHLPFEDFERALAEIARVVRQGAVLSLPHFGPPFKLGFKIPFLPEIKMACKIPYHPEHKSTGPHFWEIGKKGYNLSRVRKIISKFFRIKKDFVPWENQYHHFFVLEKRKPSS